MSLAHEAREEWVHASVAQADLRDGHPRVEPDHRVVALIPPPPRPVYDWENRTLLEGWQPNDILEHIWFDEDFHAKNSWPDPFDFHRVHTPYPDLLRHRPPSAEAPSHSEAP